MTDERTREIVVNGPVSIEAIAEGDGPLLVMLPSSSRDSEDFDEVAASFAASGLRVLRPQPRGMGGSTGKLKGLTLHDYARDVAAVIEHQRAGPAVVLGHAFGQWVARTLASDRPDLVRGVV
ncbi:MAG: alpha/beta hydrolase, partial [Acetobacteraceae bacterium]